MNSLNAAPVGTAPENRGAPQLQSRVARVVRRYLADLEDTHCSQGLYQLLLHEVEHPMLVEVMKWHAGNQSRAAATLGINRATLRKKLQQHGLLP